LFLDVLFFRHFYFPGVQRFHESFYSPQPAHTGAIKFSSVPGWSKLTEGGTIVLTSHFYGSHNGLWKGTATLCRLCALVCGL